MFELVEGCSDVKCNNCGYSFCWVCGSNNDSCLHNFMRIGCQVINLTFKFNIKSKCIRGFIILLFIAIVLPLFIFLISAMLPYFIFSEYFSPRVLNRQRRNRVCLCLPVCLCDHIFWYYKGRNKCFRYLSRAIISVPFWIIFTALSIALALLITAILIIPAWIFAIISIIKMIIWWRKKGKGR